MIQTICICGAGTMGAGIAQAAAAHGFPVLLYDLNPAQLEKARRQTEESLEQRLQKGKISREEMDEVIRHIRYSQQVNDCVADLVIEAVVEKEEVKCALFNQIDGINQADCIFASNTSSLSISSLASRINRPQRVAGMHFFNPAPVMKLVEIVRGAQTTATVVEALKQVAVRMGKRPVVCSDSPGFIVNRVARPYYLEALRLVESGAIDPADCDRLLEATGFPMGPFRLMDLIGNDVNYAVSCSVYEQLGKPARLRPSPLQARKVEAGELGRKSGSGYYSYAS